MDAIINDQECPLCGKKKNMGKKAKLIYGRLICRKCYYSFINRRQIAFVADIVLWNILSLIILGLMKQPIDAISSIIMFLIFCFKDGFSGFSPGKAMMGVQVVDKTTNKPIGFGASFKRNLPLAIPFMPLIVAIDMYKGYRTGDGWSDARVVWKKYRDKPLFLQ